MAKPQRAHVRREQTQATALLAQAERADRTDQPEPTLEGRDASPVAYDSTRRRELLAAELTAAGIEPDAVQARVLDDVCQAHPPEQAVSDSPLPGAKTRRARGPGSHRAISRPERGR